MQRLFQVLVQLVVLNIYRSLEESEAEISFTRSFRTGSLFGYYFLFLLRPDSLFRALRRNRQRSKETFRYLLTHPDFTAFERWSTYWSGVLVMRVVCHLRTRKYKLEDARSPFFEAVEMVAEEAKDGFLGGAKPSAGLEIRSEIRMQ